MKSKLDKNQKPIAWLCQNIDGTYDALSDKGCAKCFPVYTAPRELSDEEIIKRWNEIINERIKKASEK